jgi:2-hydroxychromene-2-carboxylate isomerase
MTRQFEFYFDYSSPYSYLANTKIQNLCKDTNSKVIYKPVLLGGIFKETGNISPIQNPVESKVQYGMKDLMQWAEYYQCELNFNPHFPVNSLKLMRIATLLKNDTENIQEFEKFHETCFKAMWQEGKNLAEPEEIKNLLSDLRLDADKLIEKSQSEDNKEKLKNETKSAIEKGIFGLPSFFVEDTLFFGNDRLPLLKHCLEK